MKIDLREALESANRLRRPTLERLARLVRVPTVSAQGRDLEAGAETVRRMLDETGLSAEIWSTPGAPVVYGRRGGPPGAPTVLFYGHYDVQPPDPLDEWRSPPFEPTLRDGALYGRGAADNKGQLLAHVAAIDALQRVGDLPVGVKFLIEGEEEVGSPHLAGVVRDHREELGCDLVLTADGPYHDDGRPVIIYGVRGLLYLELRARGAARDVHSGNRGGLVPAPAWELVDALGSLRGPDGRAEVEGLDRDVRPPTDAELRLLDQLPLDREELTAELGIERLPADAEESPWLAVMFRPTLNICGLSSGYAGPGAKTIVPCAATAKLDLRLVPDQDPEPVEAAIRRHLRDRGHSVDVERLAAVPPSSTPVDTPYAEPVAAGITDGTGQPPWHRPRLGGTTPDYAFTRVLGVPSLLIPYAQPDMDNHAPNEKLSVDALMRGIRSTTAICIHLADAAEAGIP